MFDFWKIHITNADSVSSFQILGENTDLGNFQIDFMIRYTTIYYYYYYFMLYDLISLRID